MAISKGRNDLQTNIQDTATMLNSFAIDINSFYEKKIENIENNIREIITKNSNEDFEITQSMTNLLKQEIDLCKDFQKEGFEMLLIKVYSFVEIYLEELLSRLSYSRNKAINEYKQDGQPMHEVSDIEKYFYILKKHQKTSLEKISDVWTDFHNFHRMRKNITHHKKAIEHITIEYINSNISKITQLLSMLELETR